MNAEIPETQAPPQEITYFSLVRLKHHSGGYLASTNANYTHSGGSGQQMVGCLPEPNELTWWMIRPSDGGDFEKKATDAVKKGDVIRLQHVQTGMNLHSHDFSASQCDQQEVSALGDSGNGNHDDDWLVETREDAEANSGAIFLFKHVPTEAYLHSHNDRHFPAGDLQFQEVTAYADDDSNNDWRIDEIKCPDSPPELHPFVTLNSGHTHRAFEKASDLQGWLQSEKEAYAWLLSRPSTSPGHSSVRDHVENHFTELTGALDSFLSSGPSVPKPLRDTLKVRLQSYYGETLLLDSKDPRFVWVRTLGQKDPATATHALASFLGQDPEIDAHSLKGTFLALSFENALLDRAPQEAASLAELKQQFQKDTAQQKAQHTQVQTAIEAKLAEANRLLAERGHAFEALFSKNRDELKGIIEAANQHASTNDAVTYWQKKAWRHFWASWGFGAVALIAGAGAVAGLLYLIHYLQPDAGQTSPEWWRISVIAIVATFGFWLVRVLVRLLYSNIHLMSDARERAVMVQVYISMLRDQHLPLEENHKILILQSLFRPAPSGVVKDDGAPTTVLDAFVTKITK